MRSLAHATRTGRELLTSGLQAVTVTRRAHLMRLRVRYASSPYPPPPPRGTGDNCVLRQGKGISAYMRHNTICDAPYVHLAVYATASPTRATTMWHYAALRFAAWWKTHFYLSTRYCAFRRFGATFLPAPPHVSKTWHERSHERTKIQTIALVAPHRAL